MSIYKGTELLAGVATNTISNAHSLFDFMWSDHIKNEMSWLRADTFSWQSGAVYVAAYNHLVADYNGGTSQTETVGSYTITYVLAADGHKITTDETTAANIYNESGVAWYYILDTANQRFKLPRENPAREELIQVIRAKGNGMTIGVTNGTYNGGLQTWNSNWLSAYTANYGTSVNTTKNSGGTLINDAQYKSFGFTTDSTKSGIISDVTESTSVYKGKKYLYFYVGQFSQSATEQTAGLNSELFNGKMDRDMSNMNPSATSKETIVGFGMPDFASGVSKTQGTIYQAEKDGYILLGGNQTSNGNANVHLEYSLDETFTDKINSIHNYTNGATGTQGQFLCVVPKGVYYRAREMGSVSNFIFYPCKGV